MHAHTIVETPGLGRVQYTSPLSDGRPRLELLFPLPVWPLPLDKQFYRFLEREPWHRRDLYYLVCPDSPEPRPILSALDWGRFFLARYQTGYGSKDWAWSKAEACLEVQQREWPLTERWHGLPSCAVPSLLSWVLAPIVQSFAADPLTHAELFHRNTRRKLARLGLLEEDH